MATDLAEFLGAALGFNLLLGIGLFPAAVLTGDRRVRDPRAAALRLPAARGHDRRDRRRDRRLLRRGALLANPPLGPVLHGALVPQFSGQESLLLAVGILGATVMPHVIYLHSALMQDRIVPESDEQAKRLYRYTRIDVVIAMSIAGLINMAMLIMAASIFHGSGLNERGLDRDAPPDADADSRRRVEHALRARASLLRPLELGGGHAVRPGRHAGVHRAADPAGGPAPGHDGSRFRRDRARAQPDEDARAQPGDPLVRDPVRADPARHLHEPHATSWACSQPPLDDGRGDRRWRR